MIGIIIGDLMVSNSGQLNENSTFTNTTITAVAIMEWLTKNEGSPKEHIEKWQTWHKVKGAIPQAVVIPMSEYSLNIAEAEAHIKELTKLGLDSKEALQLADLMSQLKMKVGIERIPANMAKGYGKTNLSQPIEILIKSKGFWEAVTKAINSQADAIITAGLAGNYYTLSDSIREKTLSLIPKDMGLIIKEFEKKTRSRNQKADKARLRFVHQ